MKCRNCGARLGPTDEWCSLCHTAVASAEPVNHAEPVNEAEEAQKPGAQQAASTQQAASNHQAATGQRVSTSKLTDTAVSEELLAELTAALREAEPVFSPLPGRLDTLNGRSGALLALAIGSALLLVVVLALTLLGLLL